MRLFIWGITALMVASEEPDYERSILEKASGLRGAIKSQVKIDDISERLLKTQYASSNGSDVVKRVIIKYKTNSKSAFRAKVKASVTAGSAALEYDFDQFDSVVLTIPQARLDNLKQDALDMIESIEDDPIREPIFDSVQDTLDHHHRNLAQVAPYGVTMVQAPLMWEKGFTGTGVKVCIIDSGIDILHPDFDSSKISGSASSNLPWNVDGCKHGTHVAGTIAAKNDGGGVVGVAYNANIYIVRVFSNSCSLAYSSTLAYAADQCRLNGAKIISMSIAGATSSSLESNTFSNLANTYDILSIAAAGNSGNSDYRYPASYSSVMSVAAVDSSGARASFSTYNNAVDISAPGVSVQSVSSGSTGQDNLLTYSGTSMATPHVSACAALLKSAVPSATMKTIRKAMEVTALDKGTTGYDVYYGNGIVQVSKAYNCLTGVISCKLG